MPRPPATTDASASTFPVIGKSVVASLPTPDVRDAVLMVPHDTTNPDYEDAPYETTTHPTAAGYRLSLITRSDDKKLAYWFYVADRADQDVYNYAITYSSESTAHPIIARATFVRRSEFEPGAVVEDPAFAGAALVAQQVAESTGFPELDSIYVKVLSIYETLPGPVLTGQEYDPSLDITTVYTKQVTAAGAHLGDARTEIEPLSTRKQLVTTYTAPEDQLDAYFISYPGVAASIQFPDVLTGITVTYNKQTGNGNYEEDGDGNSGGDSFNLSLNLRGRGQGSAAVMPDLQVDIQQVWSANVPTNHYLFYLPDNNITMASVITRLNELLELTGPDVVSAWPVFKPVAHTITLKGQRASVSAEAAVQQHLSYSDTTATKSKSEGEGESKDTDITVRTIRIPPTIHGAITITDPLDPDPDASGTAVAYARAEIAALGDGTIWQHLLAESSPSASVAATVSPESLAATAGLTSIPTSGLRVRDVNVQPFRWGYSLVHVEVVDFGWFS